MKSFWLKYTATWFGSGLSPKAPGTAGSLATLPFVYALALVGGWQAVLAFALAVSVLGVFAADAYARQLGKEDPGCIVIDETAGQALTLLAAGTGAAAPFGLALIGLGCAPIYPCLLHSTPERFGEENSQAVFGVQMASAYVGSCLMPPLFGLIAEHVAIGLFPVYMLLVLALMTAMHERTVRAAAGNRRRRL